MSTGDPNVWRWIWIIAMVVFGIGEMGVAGSFFLAPFAIGAGAAAALAFAGVPLGVVVDDVAGATNFGTGLGEGFSLFERHGSPT